MSSRAVTKKKRKVSKTKRNFYWDIGIALLFLIVFNQEITGETLHEWLALSLFVGLITHLAFHWKWVVNITKRLFSPKLPTKTRANYIINGGLLLSFIGMAVTGLMISESIMPIFGFGNAGGLWEDLHEAVSTFSIIMVGAHVLMHTKWIITHTKKYLLPSPKAKAATSARA